MNRAAVIEQLKQTHETLAKLLSLLEAGQSKQVCSSPLPVTQATPPHLRATEQGQRLSSEPSSQATTSRRA
jgi:hypothetical protein